MRKTFVFLFSTLIAFGLMACSNENQGGITEDNKSNTMYEDRKSNENHQEQKQSRESLENSDLPDGYLGKDIAKFEEIPTIREQIDLDNLVAEVESDIPNKRIILFKNNDTNAFVYKSIFIKDDQHLKIVELSKDQLIYNRTIHN